MAKRIRRARLREFEGGHLFLIQDPTAFPVVSGFLADTAQLGPTRADSSPDTGRSGARVDGHRPWFGNLSRG
jgi:hypothetical protein